MERYAEPGPEPPPLEAAASPLAPPPPPSPAVVAESSKSKKFKSNRKNRHGKQKATIKDGAVCKEARRPFHQQHQQHQQRNFRAARKRTQSFPAASKFFLPHRRPRKSTFIPPTKFLLGGNISDPLNLNSLRDEDVNRTVNAVTPRSSPLPTPPRHKNKIEVIIPPNIRDPLNLLTPLDNDEYEKQIEAAPPARSRKRRRRNTATGAADCEPESAPNDKDDADVPKKAAVEEAPCGGDVPRPSPPPAAPASPVAPSQPTDPAPPQPEAPPAPPLHLHPHPHSHPHSRPRKRLASDAADKIVSPVVPQPGAWMRFHPHAHANKRAALPRAPPPPQLKLPKFRNADKRYQYGNYDRYYGYRNLNAMMDVRLKVFEMNRHLFNSKDILDIGCNVGHVAIAIARDFNAKSVIGIDIDENLIARARKNVRNYVIVPPTTDDLLPKDKPAEDVREPSASQCLHALDRNVSVDSAGDENESLNVSVEVESEKKEDPAENKPETENKTVQVDKSNKNFKKLKRNRRSHHKPSRDIPKQYFPISCPILYGPTEVIGFPVDGKPNVFPQNISFKQANYVLKDENLINAEPPQYDLIMCLSVTKWIHLNWGDAGIKLAFKRMFAQLRPGGKLILEAQGWSSYKKKKRLTETIYKNFSSIEFFPQKFRDYLLSPEVGFSKCCVLGVPQHLSKGFRRPIDLYIKGDFTPSKVQWSDSYAPSHHQPDLNIEEQPKKVYAYVAIPSYYPNSSRWSDNNTPSYGAATPCTYQLETNSAEESPFYNPRSDSYLPSYSSSDRPKTVYASLSSPQSDYGGTPSHMSEGGGSLPPHSGVYTTMASPASPFLEPSPGNSTTPSHPFTPSHSASYDANPANKKVYASLHSPHEDAGTNGRGHPIYSPSVAGASHQGGSSPLYTGSTLCPLPEVTDVENTNSNDSTVVKSLSDHLTPVASPSSDMLTNVDGSPRESFDTE